MAADNVKKAFCLLNGINEDFTGIQHDRTVTATASKKCPPPTIKYQPVQIRRHFGHNSNS